MSAEQKVQDSKHTHCMSIALYAVFYIDRHGNDDNDLSQDICRNKNENIVVRETIVSMLYSELNFKQ